MTLVQLRHLLALAQTSSFSRAAELAHLSQPAFSRSVRALEDELGEALFDRGSRRIQLTPFGASLLDEARQIVLGADELRAGAQRQRQGQAGSVRIGLGSGPGAMLMTPLLVHMARHHPGLHLHIARGSTDVLASQLREQRLDALVIDARSLTPDSSLQVEKLAEMRAGFLVRKGHPLTRLRAPLKFAQLRDYPLATAPLSDEVARLFSEHYGPQALPAQAITLQCDDLASLVATTRRTNTVFVGICAAAPDLVELSLRPALQSSARFAWVSARRRSAPPGLVWVRERVEALLHD